MTKSLLENTETKIQKATDKVTARDAKARLDSRIGKASTAFNKLSAMLNNKKSRSAYTLEYFMQ